MFLTPVLLIRDHQGRAAHEKGLKAGAQASPAQGTHPPRGTALEEVGPCRETLPLPGSPNKGEGRWSGGVRLRGSGRTGNRHHHGTAQERAGGPSLWSCRQQVRRVDRDHRQGSLGMPSGT